MKIENNMAKVNQIKDLMDHQRSGGAFRIIWRAVKMRAPKEVLQVNPIQLARKRSRIETMMRCLILHS